MAYLLYRTTSSGTGLHYTAIGGFVLAGGGLIKAACRKHLTGQDGGWTVSRTELLQAREVDPDSHSLVVDTSPARDTVNLYEIRSISGYSYATWTPIMICFQVLFSDNEDALVAQDGSVITPEDAKRSFNDAQATRETVRSVLYLRGGHHMGDWNWGGNSRTTAALLWNNAWAFFARVPTE